jgi:hypothetical protein
MNPTGMEDSQAGNHPCGRTMTLHLYHDCSRGSESFWEAVRIHLVGRGRASFSAGKAHIERELTAKHRWKLTTDGTEQERDTQHPHRQFLSFIRIQYGTGSLLPPLACRGVGEWRIPALEHSLNNPISWQHGKQQPAPAAGFRPLLNASTELREGLRQGKPHAHRTSAVSHTSHELL